MRPFLISAGLIIAAILFLSSPPVMESVPLKQELKKIPLAFNGWNGKDFAFEKDILDKLKVDDYINRSYFRENANIGFYIGYYSAQQKGATYHSPKNCLPGSGWQIIETAGYRLPGAAPLDINRLVIQKGLNRQLVFYWYQDRGRVIRNEYMAKYYLMKDSITMHRSDGSMIRVVVDLSKNGEAAEAAAVRFMQDFVPLLNNYLPA